MADPGGGAPPAPTGLVAPEPDISIADRFLSICIPLYLTALLSVLWQLYFIFRRRTPIVADFLIPAAWITGSAHVGLLWAAIQYGFGRHNFYLSIDDRITGGQLVQISYFPWVWGVVLGRISTILLHMRLFTAQSRWFTVVYPGIIVIQVLCAGVTNLIQLLQCRPIAASWDPTISGTCSDLRIFQVAVYTVAGIAAVTDFLLSIIAIKLTRSLRMPLRTRVLLLIFVGVFIIVIPVVPAAIVKSTYVDRFRKTGDSLYDIVDLATWSVVELMLGIIAACAPAFLWPSESLLRRAGLATGRSPRCSENADAHDQQAVPGVHLGDLSSGGYSKTQITSISNQQRDPYHQAIESLRVKRNSS